MDYEAIAAALKTRFTSVTPPADEEALEATDEPPNSIGPSQIVVMLPPPEDVEWGPGKHRYSVQLWEVWAIFAQEGDFPIRMHRLAKWQKALLDQVVAHIQLGLAYVDMAEIRRIEPAQPDWAEIPYDGLRITVRVQTREVVTGAAA